MKSYISKKFVLTEEDRNIIIRVQNMLSDICDEMGNDDYFFDSKNTMWNVNRTHIRNAEEVLHAILLITDTYTSFFIKDRSVG